MYGAMFDAFAKIDGGGSGRGASDNRRIELDEWMKGWSGVREHGFVALANVSSDERAKQVFRDKCMLPQCALKIASYCETKGAKKEAIEFLILGGKRENAFVIAQSHQEMDEYAKIVLKHNDKDVEERLKIAQYYEGK
jgi:hypothetical protein